MELHDDPRQPRSVASAKDARGVLDGGRRLRAGSRERANADGRVAADIAKSDDEPASVEPPRFGAVPQRDEPDAQKRRWCHECSECHDVQPGGDTVAAREAVSDRYGDNGDDGCGERGRQKTLAQAVRSEERRVGKGWVSTRKTR